MGIEAPEGINHALRRLTGLRQHHANALRAFHQLDHQRRAAHHVDQIAGVVRGMGNPGDGKIDPLTGKKLQRAQLVPGAGNGDGFVERVAAQHLELAQRGGAVIGNLGADAGNHRIKVRQLAAFVVNRRGGRIDVHIAGHRVEDFNLMPAFRRRFSQALT